MKIAVIPARGGSRRIPGKNIREFCGRPMVAWSIEAAKSAGLFEHVLVSTDSPEIAAVARKWKAEVPFLRPDELSGDHVETAAVIAHAVQWARETGWPISTVCCIYATAPLLQVEDLRRGSEALGSGDWDFAFSATEFRSSIFRAFRQLPEGGVEMFFPDQYPKRSQDLPVALHDAGQFYFGRPDAWDRRQPIFGRRSVPVLIPHWRVQDIDSEDDWRRAELLTQSMPAIGRGDPP